MTNERAEPRHRVELQGRYRTGNGLAKDVTVSDLSTGGCKFFDRFCNLSQGDFLSIRIGSIGPIDAEVRWARENHVGIRFQSPIHPSVLAHMAPTIEGWVDEGGNTTQRQDAADMAQSPQTQYLQLKVRAPTLTDLRKVLASETLSLPINTYAEATDFFYKLLEEIAEIDPKSQ